MIVLSLMLLGLYLCLGVYIAAVIWILTFMVLYLPSVWILERVAAVIVYIRRRTYYIRAAEILEMDEIERRE